MTRQNSRPAKKKQSHRSKENRSARQTPKANYTATVVQRFVPTTPLKAKIQQNRRRDEASRTSSNPKPGTAYSYGRCDIHRPNGKDTYTIRIYNFTDAQSILNVPPGTKIQLNNAAFVDSSYDRRIKEVSASSFDILKSEELQRPQVSVAPAGQITSANPQKSGWVLYQHKSGIKQKNGVILNREMIRLHSV